MEVKIHISNNNQAIKELTEGHSSTLPSLISAIRRIKESTNSFLTELINNSNEGSGNGDGDLMDQDDEEEEEEPEEEKKHKNKRRTSSRQSGKRQKT